MLNHVDLVASNVRPSVCTYILTVRYIIARLFCSTYKTVSITSIASPKYKSLCTQVHASINIKFDGFHLAA